jgi:superoxide dismutase, Cu-Zn family
MKRQLGVLIAGIAMLVGSVMIPAQSTIANGDATIAVATLIDGTGATVGNATFKEIANGRVRVSVFVAGLSQGKHGIHVHAVGSCVTPAFTSAGSHFNPTGALHGDHAGDLKNISINARGAGRLRVATARFTISAGAFSLLDGDGSALVIHAGQDDLVTNPTGNSGARVVCGVLQAA